jgi:hypothetical protein
MVQLENERDRYLLYTTKMVRPENERDPDHISDISCLSGSLLTIASP